MISVGGPPTPPRAAVSTGCVTPAILLLRDFVQAPASRAPLLKGVLLGGQAYIHVQVTQDLRAPFREGPPGLDPMSADVVRGLCLWFHFSRVLCEALFSGDFILMVVSLPHLGSGFSGCDGICLSDPRGRLSRLVGTSRVGLTSVCSCSERRVVSREAFCLPCGVVGLQPLGSGARALADDCLCRRPSGRGSAASPRTGSTPCSRGRRCCHRTGRCTSPWPSHPEASPAPSM